MIKSKRINAGRFYYHNLYKDYIFNFERIGEFYQYDYRKPESYRKRLHYLQSSYEEKNRLKVYEFLKNYNKSIGCGPKTLENIEKFKSKNSAVIVGGQQPGFLSGPLFIIFKILTILKLSNFFQEELKIPIIPCFWNASDDSDLSQVDDLNIIGDNELVNIKLDLLDFSRKNRYSDIYISSNKFEEVVRRLEDILYPTDFKSKIIDFYKNRITEAFKNDSAARTKISISTFFSDVITGMFSDYGIVIIDPADIELKKLSFDLLEFDADNHCQMSNFINSAGKKLDELNYHHQLDSIPETLNFFYCREGIRYKIYSDDKNWFEIEGKRYGRQELQNLFRKNPSNISLNVVLRPLLQDRLFPVLCSISGPGEIGYFAQLKPVYDIYHLEMPVIYPRFSATIIEKSIGKTLTKLQITNKKLESGKEEIIKQEIDEKTKINLPELMKTLGNDIQTRLEELEKIFMDFEMNISSSFDRIKRNLKKEIGVLNKKIYSELKRQNEFTIESVNKVYINIFPNNNLQEREISIITYLNKYGFEFINNLYSIIEPLDFSHKFLEII